MNDREKLHLMNRNAVYTAKAIYFCISAVFCVIGIFLIIKNPAVLRHTWTLCGVCLILHGCIEIKGHYLKDLYLLAFSNGLYVGGLSILMGILLLIFVRDYANFLYVLLGTALLADALEKIELARPAKSFGIVFWWIILGSGILTAGVSIYLMASKAGYNYVSAWKTGLLLLSAGLLNALTALIAVHAPTKIHPLEEVLQEESPWGL